MTNHEINNEYFKWLYSLACKKKYAKSISCRKLLMLLHDTDFRYSIQRDQNRADDGKSLRWRFVCENDYPNIYEDYLNGPCSVLEMMIALAARCEETMDDPIIGDRTSQWFWGMMVSLGLGSMFDDRFDKRNVIDILDRFMDREYEPNGKGGLFTIRNSDEDMRTVEIWKQMCWYLDSIV